MIYSGEKKKYGYVVKFFNESVSIYSNIERLGLMRRLINLVRYGMGDMFVNVEIETSSKCNRKCKYCPVSIIDRGDYLMNESLFKSIVDQLCDMKFDGIIRPHFYNEPLLDKRLPRLLKYVNNNLPKASIHVYTNGDFLNEYLYGELIDSGVEKIIATSHGGRISNSMENLIENHKKENVIYHQYIGNNMKLFNRGGTVKVDNMVIMEKCNIPTYNITINYLGQVVLCCNDALSENVMGDLNVESILDVWKKRSFVRLRKRILNGDYQLDICKKCTNRS